MDPNCTGLKSKHGSKLHRTKMQTWIQNCSGLNSKHGSKLHEIKKKVDMDLICIETKNIDMAPNCMGLKSRHGSKLQWTKQ